MVSLRYDSGDAPPRRARAAPVRRSGAERRVPIPRERLRAVPSDRRGSAPVLRRRSRRRSAAQHTDGPSGPPARASARCPSAAAACASRSRRRIPALGRPASDQGASPCRATAFMTGRPSQGEQGSTRCPGTERRRRCRPWCRQRTRRSAPAATMSAMAYSSSPPPVTMSARCNPAPSSRRRAGTASALAAVEADPDAPIGRQPAQHLDRPADPPLGVVGVDQQGDRARGDAGERRERAGLVGLGTIRSMIESSRGVELGPPKTAESARTSTLPSAAGAGSKAPSARVEGTAARHRLRLRRVSPSVVRCSPRAASTRQSNLTAEVAGVGGRRSLSAGRSEPNNRRVRGGRDAVCGSRRGG